MSRLSDRKRTHENRKRGRNKHGRTGCPKPAPGPVTEKVNPESMNYRAGFKNGVALVAAKDREFLETLLTKRNVKDVRGLIEKHLERRGLR